MNFEIVLATNNKNKLKEVRSILSPHGVVVYGINDLNLKVDDVEENGSTYAENAMIKAKSLQKVTDLPIIADDSGIEIEALDNGPGIFSARYVNNFGNYQTTMEHIISKVKEKNNNRAKFYCDIVLLNYDIKPHIFEGIVDGHISDKILGTTGFGYDPIFICDATGKTYAEMGEKEKNKYSHRALALKKLITYLRINQSIK